MDAPTRTLLFLGAGIESVEAIRQAKRAGYRVFAADRDESAPGRAEAAYFFKASVYHVEETLRVVLADPKSREIDGLMMVGVDAPLVHAKLAAALGLPGQSVRTAEIVSDKALMKETLRSRGVAVPDFWRVESLATLRRLVGGSGGWFVLKPVDSRGARGVLKISAASDLAWSLEHSRSQSPTGRVMLERWLSGPQYSSESLVWAGRQTLCGLARREYESTRRFEPFIVENGGETPAPLEPSQVRAFDELLERARAAIDLESGTLKGDLVWHEGKPYIIEVATRMSGGYYCTYNIPTSYGIPLVQLACEVALGRAPSKVALPAEPLAYTANRRLLLPPGRIESVSLRDPRLVNEPWVVTFQCYARAGQEIHGVQNHTDTAAIALTKGASYAEAISRAERLIANVDIVLTRLDAKTA